MKLSILILNYRTYHELPGALQALEANPPAYPYETIVMDNNSGQEAEKRDFFAMFGNKIKFLQFSENLGFGKGNNTGALSASGEYLLIHNPDVRVWPGALNTAIQYMDKHPNVGLLGGQLIFPDGTIQDSYRSFPSPFDQVIKRISFLRTHRSLRGRVSKYLMWEKNPNVTEPVDWVVGGFMLIRRKAFDQLEGFDERYFLFMEDVDLCRRMWKNGWQVVYMPEAKATHNEKRLSAGGLMQIFTKKTLRAHIKSAVQYFWKYKFESHPRQKQ